MAALSDTSYAELAIAGVTYKLTAVDAHGNESAVATFWGGGVSVAGTTNELAFAPPSPNPAQHASVLRFSLPSAGHVRATIFDAQGRVERVIAAGLYNAGAHELSWDLRDGSGRLVGAGVYFARVSAEQGAVVRRLVVTP